MTQKNLISINITEKDITAINQAIALLREKFLPILKSINPEESKQLPKMGDKTLAFVIKALEFCISNPELVPQFIDINEFRQDVKAFEQLRLFQGPLVQITDLIADSMLLAGSDAYQTALAFYKSLQIGKKMDIPKAGTIYDDLSARFPGKKKTKTAK